MHMAAAMACQRPRETVATARLPKKIIRPYDRMFEKTALVKGSPVTSPPAASRQGNPKEKCVRGSPRVISPFPASRLRTAATYIVASEPTARPPRVRKAIRPLPIAPASAHSQTIRRPAGRAA